MPYLLEEEFQRTPARAGCGLEHPCADTTRSGMAIVERYFCQVWFQMAYVESRSDFNRAISAAEHAVPHDSGIRPQKVMIFALIAGVDFYEGFG